MARASYYPPLLQDLRVGEKPMGVRGGECTKALYGLWNEEWNETKQEMCRSGSKRVTIFACVINM